MRIKTLPKGLLRSALLFSPLLAASVAVAGEADIRFCSETVHGIGTGTMTLDAWYAAALEIDSATASAFGSCTVDSVRFATGSSITAKEVTVFITRSLTETPVWETKVTSISAGQWQSVAVEGGFATEGKPFFVGYRLNEPSWLGSPLGFDVEPGSPYATLSHYSMASSEAALAGTWKYAGEEYSSAPLGNVTIGCHVSGETLPSTFVCASGVRFGEYQTPGTPFQAVIPVVNIGTETAETFTVEVSVGGKAVQTLTVKSEAPVAPGALSSLCIDVNLADDAVEEELGFRLTAVNGKENLAGSAMAAGLVNCSDGLFPRAFVVEDYTGLTCGYCPIGYVAMDKFSEDYKNAESRFVPIAVHNYGVDRMHCDGYDDFVKHYNFASAPASIVNREEHSFPSYNNLNSTWNSISHLSVAKVELAAWFVDKEKTEVNVTATTSFVRDYDDADYALAFVLTEDNVGPYSQLNYYHSDPSVPEFYNKGEHVMMMHNHVARTVIGWDGIEGSVPAAVKKGEGYPYTTVVSLDDCNNSETTRLICLLLRKSDGVVVNAEYVDLSKVKYNGVDSVEAADGGEAEYYDLQGMRLTAPAKGSIVIRRQGGRSSLIKL